MSAAPFLWAAALVFLACLSCMNTSAFTSDCCYGRQRLQIYAANEGENVDPDLFEYFDPLLSPHAYPSGISPENKPAVNNDKVQEERKREPAPSYKGKSFGFNLPVNDVNQPNESGSTPKARNEEKSEDDLFDYFDPLRSPHSYPDGIKSKQESMASMKAPPAALDIVEDPVSIGAASSSNDGKKKKVGVLLMDHGSRKEKSNARLQEMARLYQLTLEHNEDEDDENTTTEIIVRAAHMEIALPSIPDGLKELKDLGVDEIVCHPFFLSADGRHVKEDIPQIIGDAIEDIWGESTGAKKIPITTTAPVGSNTQLMLGAIHSLVRENSQILNTRSGVNNQ